MLLRTTFERVRLEDKSARGALGELASRVDAHLIGSGDQRRAARIDERRRIGGRLRRTGARACTDAIILTDLDGSASPT